VVHVLGTKGLTSDGVLIPPWGRAFLRGTSTIVQCIVEHVVEPVSDRTKVYYTLFMCTATK